MIRIQTIPIKCPICGKPDFCLISEERDAAICTRVSDGSIKKCGDAGWLHNITGDFKPKKFTPQPKPYVDWEKLFHTKFKINYLQNSYPFSGSEKPFNNFIEEINQEVLDCFDVGFSSHHILNTTTPDSLILPMYNSAGKIIGLQSRGIEGNKKFLKNSNIGVFLGPQPLGQIRPYKMVICEGFSDTATAYSLLRPEDGSGFSIYVGRPNCTGGNLTIYDILDRLPAIQKVVFICDRDKVGFEGALKCALGMKDKVDYLKMIVPPEGIKDLREWKRKGLTGKELRGIISKAENYVSRMVK